MGIYDAGAVIKEARIKTGLTLEALAEGICTSVSLSRIEHNKQGISPSTFQALMSRMGNSYEIFPLFENQTDFDCFWSLTHAQFHLDAWQIEPAYHELKKIEKLNWNYNKFHYQTWLILYSILQYKSGKADHELLESQFSKALHISKPNIKLNDFVHSLLSVNEIECLIYLAQEMLYLEKAEICLTICLQIFDYFNNSHITFSGKDKMLAECAIVYIKYLICHQEYNKALQLAQKYRQNALKINLSAPLLELTFLIGFCNYKLNYKNEAVINFKNVIYAACAIQSPYMTMCCDFLKKERIDILFQNPGFLLNAPLKEFSNPTLTDISDFSDGTFNIYSPDVLTIGKLIRNLRVRQNVKQRQLCQGLCSISKLSKIENSELNPDVFLAQMLLQRLGISEIDFKFGGSKAEAQLYNLRFALNSRNLYEPDFFQTALQQIEERIPGNPKIFEQLYAYEKAFSAQNSLEKIDLLKKALEVTLESFDINNIKAYRLSWIELTILNNIAAEYLYAKKFNLGSFYLQQILLYHNEIIPDCILQAQTLTTTLQLIYYHLHSQSYHKVILDLFQKNYNNPILRYDLSAYEKICFYLGDSIKKCPIEDSTFNAAHDLNNQAELFDFKIVC